MNILTTILVLGCALGGSSQLNKSEGMSCAQKTNCKTIGSVCTNDAECIDNSNCTIIYPEDGATKSRCQCKPGFTSSDDSEKCVKTTQKGVPRAGVSNTGTSVGAVCSTYNMPCNFRNSNCLSRDGNFNQLVCQCDISAVQENGSNNCMKVVGTRCEMDLECLTNGQCTSSNGVYGKYCDCKKGFTVKNDDLGLCVSVSTTVTFSATFIICLQLIVKMTNL